MKIGIITFHDASNYGACLQAQATCELFIKAGYKAEIIDYQPQFRKRKYTLTGRLHEAISRRDFKMLLIYFFGSFGILSRNKAFSKHRQRYFRLSQEILRNSSQLEKYANKYDALVAGSDQIWNPTNTNGDLNYLLGFAKDHQVKISFASSITCNSLPVDLRDEYLHLLSQIKYRSVRELWNLERLLPELKGTFSQILDPVLTQDAAYWNQFKRETNVQKSKKYTLLYVNNSSYFSTSIKELDSVVSIGSFNLGNLVSKNYSYKGNVGPGVFISLISSAQLVLTSSYHGVILCLIFNVPFIVHMSGNIGRDARIRELLNKYGLEGRVYDGKGSLSDYKSDMDFTQFNEAIEYDRNTSFQFIKNIA